MTRWGTVRRRGASWMIDLRIGPDRIRRHYPTRTLADAALAELRRAKALGQRAVAGQDRIVYEEAIEGFRAHVDTRGLGKRTVESYQGELAAVAEWWGRREIGRTRLRDVEAWVAAMQRDKLAPSTIRHRLTRLSQLHQWALDQDMIAAIPCPVRMPPLRTARAETISEPDLAELVDRAGKHHDRRVLAAVLLGADAGLRVSEIADLTGADVDLERRVLVVRWGKGGKSRRVPILTGRLETALRNLTGTSQEPDQKLLGVRSRDGVYRLLRPVWPEPRVHALRHRFATVALGVAEVAPDEVRQWLGHGSLRTSAIYTHARPSTPPPQVGARLEAKGHGTGTGVPMTVQSGS